MSKNLLDLLVVMPQAQVIGSLDKLVTDVTADSRAVREGSLFVCLKGAHVDGHNYINQAYQAGATCVIVEDEIKERPEGLTVIKVADTRSAMAYVAPWFFDYPGKKMRMIGVTGTNGKTTTTNIIRAILRKAGFKVGLIGTINVMIEDVVETSHNTTPDVIDLERILFRMEQAGCQYVVMEVSSHALALNRVAGCEYDVAVLTNITQDHLDFHKTFESYRDAKAKLFIGLAEGVKQNKTAVFNMDDASSGYIIPKVKVPLLTYGEDRSNDIYPTYFKVEADRMQLDLHTPAGDMSLVLHITGEFNVYNVMAAVSSMLAEKVSLQVISDTLNGFKGVPGRFQLVETGKPYAVIVDYAHTPDGLENVLRTARLITKNTLWVVFGCGGDRDSKKRPIMGKIAFDLADKIVITSDNPRTEEPELIISDIEKGLPEVQTGKFVIKLTDRKAAIEYALQHVAEGDVILIAGKGHENYQILKTETIHFDDAEVVRAYWQNRVDK
ncbi:MAG TPA: UDP-N-acetylmuramoyl-L-alanyl-D-glutamate--2,6-diaminopimelate ligase [Candidatus Avacidaminococcus intestinavium]|uniref:UDP-N-acetylmuramoyl-L-alanyl-D-glutamate--2,6-diaminopimelate ligase n=1 Tax=Candidatus Avacidaminococcus intestinavium TaxID=2840684 RepID=A0A9D1MNT5_9FIRM|nr:UDP-N-acetylmuramoyl-L-alanyl-D-glutamate--2,6-diaminopimelate ligase [Candidatus Avacidaminococcus intestinavium]